MVQSMIHENQDLLSIQKMQYLFSALTEEAKDVISSLEASEKNYIEAWRMLKDRYDDDYLIIQKHIKALFEQPIIAKENHSFIKTFIG